LTYGHAFAQGVGMAVGPLVWLLLLLATPAWSQLRPAGDELQISTTMVESQHFPAVAGADGGFVVTCRSAASFR
jgi:hypothetical protein